jgi:hypothetical protein
VVQLDELVVELLEAPPRVRAEATGQHLHRQTSATGQIVASPLPSMLCGE